MISNGMNLESARDSFFCRIKDMEGCEKELLLNQIRNCLQICSQKYIDRKSYERRKRGARDDASIGIEFEDISEAEREKRTREFR